MRKNIVIIEHEPLTQKTKSNLFVEEFQLKGFKVQYWDISQYIFPGMQLANQIDDSCQIHFHALAQIKDELSKHNIKDTIFIVEVRDSWNARLVYKLLSDVDAFTVRIDMYGNTFLYIPFSQKLKNLYFQDLVCGDINAFFWGTWGNLKKQLNPEFRKAKSGVKV